ncbi:MAG: hypothetical protein JSV08_06520 [Acidobacteriota bacterium]|nr:MAG: hypothetical protein JSV08_06520 [Acidobacteriota bacterium]
MKHLFKKTTSFVLVFAVGMLAGLCLDGGRVEAGFLDNLKVVDNFKVVDDLKSVGKSLKQMNKDIRSLQKEMEEVREARMNIAKRLHVESLIDDDDDEGKNEGED